MKKGVKKKTAQSPGLRAFTLEEVEEKSITLRTASVKMEGLIKDWRDKRPETDLWVNAGEMAWTGLGYIAGLVGKLSTALEVELLGETDKKNRRSEAYAKALREKGKNTRPKGRKGRKTADRSAENGDTKAQ